MPTPTIEEISEVLIRKNILRAVTDVFETMLGRQMRLREIPEAGTDDSWPPMPPVPDGAKPQVVGTVGFIGQANGLIYLYLDEPFAKECTGLMLGIEERNFQQIAEDSVNDAIGELTNMVVGSFKNGLCDAGYPCKLTIPSILRGRNFCVGTTSAAQRRHYSFECDGHRVVADILVKSED